jgi:hypothetical protein
MLAESGSVCGEGEAIVGVREGRRVCVDVGVDIGRGIG